MTTSIGPPLCKTQRNATQRNATQRNATQRNARLVNCLRTSFAVILLLLGGLQSSAALATPTTPTTDFTDNGDGTVTHKITGLTWKRCSEEQTWTGSACRGTAQAYTWAQAIALTSSFAGKSDWRLPTIAELVTIVERESVNPAINTTIFPNTSTSYFWSASAYANNSDAAWRVNFYYGYDNQYNKSYAFPVRLVRGGQSLGSLGLYTPSSDFSDHGNGTVTHQKTSLTWKRCAEGQTWNGSTCTGREVNYSWVQATALSQTYAGSSDWRLPTQNELQTLVEYSIGYPGPAINNAMFPNTSAAFFWSASAYVYGSDAVWFVDFNDGSSSGADQSSAFPARLVRGSRSPSTSAYGPDCLFNWAEGYAPANFSPAGSASQTLGAYYYRYYAQSDSYLASSSDGNVYYLNKISGLVNLGPLTQWYAKAGCQP